MDAPSPMAGPERSRDTHSLSLNRPIAVGAGGQRLHARISLPLETTIAGVELEVLNWGIGGFAARRSGGIAVERGDVVTPAIRLPVNGFIIEFGAPSRVAWSNAHEVGFQFLALEPDQAGILHQIVQDHLSGQARRIEHFIEVSAHAVGQTRGGSRARRALRLGATISVLAAAVSALGLLLSSTAFTTRSETAAVVVDGVTLRSVMNGVLTGEALRPGIVVAAGQPLFAVATPGMIIRAAELSASLGKAELVVERRKQKLEALRRVNASYKAMTSSRLEILKTKLAALRSQVDLYRNMTVRDETLVPKGFAAQNTIDMEKINRITRDAAYQDAEGDVALAKMQADLANGGLFSLQTNRTLETESTMQLHLSEAEAAIDAIHAKLTAVNEAAEVKSPCDCVVIAANAKPGDTVLAGNWIYSVRPKTVTPKIEALIPAADVSGWTIGAPARIILTQGSATGRLERLSFDLQPDLVGLPHELVKTNRKFAIATIALDQDIDLTLIGTPAEVVLPRNPLPTALARLQSVIGQ
jgi:multidrug resistance efflux pump